MGQKSNKDFKLIDIGAREIVVLGQYTGLSYATLSYVCGSSETLWKLPKASDRWFTDFEGKRRHPLPTQVPQTIADAMVVAQQVGLSYLWVDSFCISQDDPVELATQINAMYEIYTYATLCIVAASAKDSQSGIPGISSPRRIFRGGQVHISDCLTLGLPHPRFEELLEVSSYMGRAWCFQELILSKRCLIFTETEAFFYCAESSYRESHTKSRREHWSRSESNAYRIGNSTIIRNAGRSKKVVDNLIRLYDAAVEEYSRRQLSFQMDGLNAFQGLAGLLGRTYSTEILYGCPRAIIVNCFLWTVVDSATYDISQHPQRRRCGRPDGNYSDKHLRPLLPSWAWAGWTGHFKIMGLPYYFLDSDVQVLEGAHLPAIRAPPLSKYNFKTDGDDYQIRGILPLFTRTASLPLVPHKEFPGILMLQNADGDYAQEINACGMQGSWDKAVEGGVLIQIWVQTSKGNQNVVCVLFVEVHDVPELQGNSGDSLGAELLYNSASKPLTAQRSRYANDPSFRKNMPEKCPKELHIGSLAQSDLQNRRPLLCTRVGVGFMKLRDWLDVKPEPRIILLA